MDVKHLDLFYFGNEEYVIGLNPCLPFLTGDKVGNLT